MPRLILWYEPRNTIMHRLSPYTKLVIFLWLNLIGGTFTRLEVIIPATILAFILALLAKVPREWIWALIGLNIAAFPVQIWTALFMMDPAFYHTLPPSITETVIFQITSSEFTVAGIYFGAIGLSFGGLYWAIYMTLMSVIAFATIFTAIYTISPTQQVQALAQLHMPPPVLFIVMLPYRFLNVIAAQVERCLSAQTLRGFKIKKSRNPFTRAWAYMPVILPMIRVSVAMIDEVTMAAATRAFGTGKITPIQHFTISIAEWILIAILIVTALVGEYFLFVHHIGMV